MLHRLTASASDVGTRFRIIIISAVRILGDCLSQALTHADIVESCDYCSEPDEALAKIVHCQPSVVLLDAALGKGRHFITGVRTIAPTAKIVVFAVAENPDEVIPWVEAGAEGFIPAGVAANEVTPLLTDILRGEQICTAHVASGLLRRLSEVTRANGNRRETQPAPALTKREFQVLELICAGMSNKEIARRLAIEVATTKSHVHNVLAKLNVQKRSQAVVWMRDFQTRLPTL
jgi:two-component system nitrate/nitrite response regulator NarL